MARLFLFAEQSPVACLLRLHFSEFFISFLLLLT
jgi:hypothetical protein